jgi:hypothetical protein
MVASVLSRENYKLLSSIVIGYCFLLTTYGLYMYNGYIMNRLTPARQTQIIASLVEGNSLRATARMCGVAFNTVLKLLPQIGRACVEYQDKALRNLKCKRIQCDEIWSFCYAKEKNVPADKRDNSASGTFGHGWRSMRIRSWCRLSWLAREALIQPSLSWMT